MSVKWIEIARTGTFEDSAGRLRTFTARDLDAIARSYDPAKRDAPLTFGHPQTDKAPAYGWVEKLKSEGGRLYANFSQVPEQAEGGKTLDKDGHLKDSIDYHATSSKVMVGSNLPYARIHQKGVKTSPHVIRPKRKKALAFGGVVRKKVNHPGSDIPARPYLGISDDDREEIMDTMTDFLEGAFK